MSFPTNIAAGFKALLRPPLSWGRAAQAPWHDPSPIREELFGPERLEDHATSLARIQTIALRPRRVLALNRRLKDNAAALLAAYRSNGAALIRHQPVSPAAQWLLDNYHLVEKQLVQIALDLPEGYYRQLPKLAEGPLPAIRAYWNWPGPMSPIPTASLPAPCWAASCKPISRSSR